MTSDPSGLDRRQKSIAFYEDRFAKGYVEEWPDEKKDRLAEIIRDLQLPERGAALDFGCGNGVFTDVIKGALPRWEVYGTDISSIAVANASVRYPECRFFVVSERGVNDQKCDFLFTHHVLEHVYNLEEVWCEMISFLKPTSSMLHILPCGNEGSFEHSICLLSKNGINRERGNRYFFEEAGHLRRLDTEQVRCMAESYGFQLRREYYANQHYGAIDYITAKSPVKALLITYHAIAISKRAKRKLVMLRCRLLAISLLRQLAIVFDRIRVKKTKKLKHYVFLVASAPFYPISRWVNDSIKRKAEEEWKAKRQQRNGSEMYLYFIREYGK